MRELIFIPVIAVMILGFMTQLSDIAMSTSDKTLNYADQMDSAVDCAFRGIPVEVCSPGLSNTNFEADTKEVIQLNKRMIEAYGMDIEETMHNQTQATVEEIEASRQK